MKKVLLSMLLIITISITLSSCKKEKNNTQNTEIKAEIYQCPMDCEEGKTYNKPGSCPVCKMDLKPIKNKDKHHH